MISEEFILCLDFLAQTYRVLPSVLGSFPDSPLHLLGNLDIAATYDSNHWIDILVYLLIFIPVARLTLGRRYEGRDGRILSTVVGVVLAFSLYLAEIGIGFSIRSLGPVAAGILIFVVGFIIYCMFKVLGVGSTTAGSVTFILVYFLALGSVPNFSSWIQAEKLTPWMNLVLGSVILLSIYRLFTAWEPESWPAGFVRPLVGGNLNAWRQHSGGDDVPFWVKKNIETLSTEGMKATKEIITDLKEIQRLVEEYKNDRKAWNPICDRIQAIWPRENFILKQLAVLKDVCQKIDRFDLESLDELRARWEKIPIGERENARSRLLMEKRKILSDEKLLELENRLLEYEKNSCNSLATAVGSLRSKQPGQARDWLVKAIRCEEEGMIIFREMKSLEDRLMRLMLEFRSEEQAAK